MRYGLASLALLALALASPAQDVGRPPRALEARQGRLVASVDLAPAFPPEIRKPLSNGLTNVVVLYVALLPAYAQEPAALYGREVDVLYDVWDETYGVTVKDPGSPQGSRRTFRRFEELRSFLSDATAIDLGPLSGLGDARWVIQTRVELNPISRELLQRTREFLANPAASGRGAPSRSILGAMASYLLRSADPGAQVHVFRSAPFTAQEVRGR